MKFLLVVLTMFGLMDTAIANNPDIQQVRSIRAADHSCAQIKSWVQQEGVVHIRVGLSANYYYASGRSCRRGYLPVAGWLYAGPQSEFCHVGYLCRRSHGSDD